MPKATMRATEDQTNGWPDGGVPDVQMNPPRPVTCCQEHKDVEVGTRLWSGTPPRRFEWIVRGWDKATGRLWVRSVGGYNTKWLMDCITVEPPACTPEDSPVCLCGYSPEGFHDDPETGLYVHDKCGKPTAAHLSGMAARAGMVQW